MTMNLITKKEQILKQKSDVIACVMTAFSMTQLMMLPNRKALQRCLSYQKVFY